MSQLSELHELIQSLSKAEKRNFQRSGASYSGSQLMELFSILNRWPEFDEGEIMRDIETAGFQKNLPTLQRRLRRLLINSIRSLYSHQGTESRLLYLLDEIQFLYKRNLPVQALRKIKTARHLALSYSRIPIALELNYYHRQLLLTMQQRGAQYENIRREEEELVALAGLQLRLDNLQTQARALVKRRQPELAPTLQELLTAPDLQVGMEADDFLCRLYAHYAVGVLQFGLGRYTEALERFRFLVQQWQQFPAWINEKPRMFVGSVRNYQTSLLFTGNGDLEHLEQLFDDFAGLRFQDPDIRLQFEFGNYQTRLLLVLNQARLSEGNKLAPELDRWLQEHEKHLGLSRILSLRLNLFTYYFLREDFSYANRMIGEIYQVSAPEERKDIREFAQMVEPIVQWELGNVDVFENRLRSLKRYFLKRNPIPVLWSVLQPFYQGGQLGDRNALQGLAEQLQAILDAHPSGALVGMAEVAFWAQARSRSISLEAVFKAAVSAAANPR